MHAGSGAVLDLRDSEPGAIVVDAQKAFASREGSLAAAGTDVSAAVETVPAIRDLLARVRKAGLPVFFTRSVRRPDGRDAPGRNASVVPGIYRDREPICLRGTLDVEYVDGLEPEPDEYEVTKQRYDAFEGSNLERWLRTEAVGTVLLCGFMTNGCVEATARTAYERGFDVVLADDCAASITGRAHRAAVENVDTLLGAAAESDGIQLPEE